MNIELLLTGDEVMSGDTVDSNSAYIAQRLKEMGLGINKKITVGDNTALLIDAMQSMSKTADVIIINGGLGPTVDDMTALALGEVLKEPLVLNEEAHMALQMMAERYHLRLNEANLKQAYLPQSAQVIPNPVGTACGFSVEHNDCLILCTPGVPRELFTMMQQQIMPILERRFNIQDTARITRLRSFGLGESSLQQLFTERLSHWPNTVDLGFRVYRNLVELKVTTHGRHLDTTNSQCAQDLQLLLPEHIFGVNDDTLASVLIDLLREKQLTVATAESCTGGMISSQITQVSGASDVFESGFVTYSNKAKAQHIHVQQHTLDEHGAVSEAVVKEMVAGTLAVSGADIGVAVSGIAGPTGGTPDKPNGTVWIAWGFANNIKAVKYVYDRPRLQFQEIVTTTALDLLRREILGLSTDKCHFRDYNVNQ